MHITRALALKLLKRQDWGGPRTAMLARRPGALRWLRQRLTSACGRRSSPSIP
jgi:hypothetical protein